MSGEREEAGGEEQEEQQEEEQEEQERGRREGGRGREGEIERGGGEQRQEERALAKRYMLIGPERFHTGAQTHIAPTCSLKSLRSEVHLQSLMCACPEIGAPWSRTVRLVTCFEATNLRLSWSPAWCLLKSTVR